MQTSLDNKDDGDLFVRLKEKGGGLGVNGSYSGKIERDRWYRLAWVVRAAGGRGGVGMIHKFVDGRFVGGQNTGSAPKRWALEKQLHLFTDDDGSTGEGYVASIRFSARAWEMEQVEKLGGPHASGTAVRGPVMPGRRLAARAGIIAHRGSACCAPENTIAAIRHAFMAGADHVEVDVQLSRDGQAFLLHDSRLERTTDGAGNASSWSMQKLKTLDAGSWFGEEFKGARIPTLVSALRTAKGHGRLMLDVKDMRMGPAIARALQEAGVDASAVWLWQNNNEKTAKHFLDSIPGAQIVWGAVPKDLDSKTFAGFKALGIVGFDVDYRKVTRAFVRAAHTHGMFVSVYTILDAKSLEKALAAGVDYVETDYPGQMRDWMAPPR